MLPEFLTGSYKRYKEDTSVFATWLSSTARDCGHRIPEQSPHPPLTVQPTNGASTRLKGNARKQSQRTSETLPAFTTSHVISTKDLLMQANAIANYKSKHMMPDAVYRVARRAINARSRCLAWFEQTRPEDESNLSHQHFIGVLEKALELLKPCLSVVGQDSIGSDQEVRPGDVGQEECLQNRFSLLDVEDINEDDLDITSTDVLVSKSKTTQSKLRTVGSYEIQMEPHMEVAFKLYCFFEDLHRIQEFLKDTWTKYAAGELELMAASFTSNIAFELVQRTEEEMISDFHESYRKDASYSKLAAVLLDFQSGPTLHSDFIYNSTYSTLAKFIAYNSETSCGYFGALPVPSAQLHYLFNPELMPASGNWEADDKLLTQYLHEIKFRSGLKKDGIYFDQDRIDDILSEGLQNVIDSLKPYDIGIWVVFGATVLLDIWKILGSRTGFGYLELLRRGGKAKTILGSKSTPKSLCEEWGDGNLVMTAWATITLIETSSTICIKDCWNESNPDHSTPIVLSTYDAAAFAKARGEQGMHGIRPLHILSAPPSLQPNDPKSTDRLKLGMAAKNAGEAVSPAESFSTLAVPREQANPVPQVSSIDVNSSVEEIEAYIVDRNINTELSMIPHDTAFYDKHNPIYCGMEAINLTMYMEAAGIYLANNSCTDSAARSVLAISHLLNAARQMGLLEGPWKALDTIMSLHMTRMFAGALPTTAKDMYSRLCAVTGFHTSSFARNQRGRPQDMPKFSSKNLAQISHTATSKVLQRYFSEEHRTIEETLIEAEAQYLRDNKRRRSPESSAMRNSKRHLTLLEMLTKLRDASHSDIPFMDFDYVGLHRLCGQMCERIAAEIELRGMFDHRGMQRGVSALGVFDGVLMALPILYEVSEWNLLQDHKKNLKEPVPKYPPQLSIAAEIMQEFLLGEAHKTPPVYKPIPIPSLESTQNAKWRYQYAAIMNERDRASKSSNS